MYMHLCVYASLKSGYIHCMWLYPEGFRCLDFRGLLSIPRSLRVFRQEKCSVKHSGHEKYLEGVKQKAKEFKIRSSVSTELTETKRNRSVTLRPDLLGHFSRDFGGF